MAVASAYCTWCTGVPISPAQGLPLIPSQGLLDGLLSSLYNGCFFSYLPLTSLHPGAGQLNKVSFPMIKSLPALELCRSADKPSTQQHHLKLREALTEPEDCRPRAVPDCALCNVSLSKGQPGWSASSASSFCIVRYPTSCLCTVPARCCLCT